MKDYYKRRIHGDHSSDSPTALSKEEQQKMMEKTVPPENDYERSYIKYACRKLLSFRKSKGVLFCINLISFFALFPLFVFFLIRGLLTGKNRTPLNDSVVRRDDAFGTIDDILPVNALKEYGDYTYVKFKEFGKGFLKSESLRIFLTCVLNKPFRCYYLLMVLLCLSDYTRIINRYRPKAIFTFADEKNFAKPLATLLCEQYGVMHMGFMHGECYYQIDKGYFRYSRYFTWDELYTKMFREMHCAGDMVVYNPARLSSKHFPAQDTYPVFLTYYESANDESSLMALAEVFKDIEKTGKKCVLRPHPRMSDMNAIRKYFSDEQIQSYKSVPIDDSLKNTQYVAALCSTVLMEAYYGGKQVVVDDYTDTAQFAILRDKGYIILQKDHLLLSDILDRKGARI